MPIILAIDAAWTTRQPSGVALVDTERRPSSCAAVAPGYADFLAIADGVTPPWDKHAQGGEAPVERLLAAAAGMVGRRLDLAAVDMPMATETIRGRREADRAVSREFGSRWCAAHSPSEHRPGLLGKRISAAFNVCGYSLVTVETPVGTTDRLLEVYPHPALLALLNRSHRVPYKVGRASRYWPDGTTHDRRVLVHAK